MVVWTTMSKNTFISHFWICFYLFSQHCLLPTFILEQHVKVVHKKLIESVGRLNKSAKRQLAKALIKTARDLAASSMPKPPQRVEHATTSKDEGPTQRVVTAPLVTTITRNNTPTEALLIQTQSQTPRKSPSDNPNIIIEYEGNGQTPTPRCITMFNPIMISKKEANIVPNQV
jgi:hypothetical protein